MSLAEPDTQKALDLTESNTELLTTRKAHFLPTAVHYYKEPLHLVRAKGSYVYDEKGQEYLDVIGGIVCISAGHNHPKIQQRMIEMIQNDEIQHTTTLYLNRFATRLERNGVRRDLRIPVVVAERQVQTCAHGYQATDLMRAHGSSDDRSYSSAGATAFVWRVAVQAAMAAAARTTAASGGAASRSS